MDNLKQSLTKRELLRGIYRSNYYQFFKDAFHVLEPEVELVDNWHIEYICNILQEEVKRIERGEPKTSDIIINIPPRSLKSMLVTIIFNAWAWIRMPHLKFMAASYSESLAVEHCMETRRLLLSDWYQELFGDLFKLEYDQNTKSNFKNSEKGIRHSFGIGSSITGIGADVIICDDPIKVKDANSELARKTAIDFWNQTMYSRLNDQKTGIRIIIMQRLHENDLTGYLLFNKANYRHICIPAELDDNISPPEFKDKYKDELFFPDRFTKPILDDIRKAIGTLGYVGQYQQKPSPTEGNLILRDWFRYFHPADLPEDIPRNFRTDTAYGKEQSDNSATICYSTYNNNLYIWNVWKANLTFPEFIHSYKDFLFLNRHTPLSRTYFEPKASGVSVVQQLRLEKVQYQNTQIGINLIEGQSPKDAKETRVAAAAPTIEGGRVFLLANQPWIEEFIDETAVFPNGKFDDQVDVLCSIINEELNAGFAFVV